MVASNDSVPGVLSTRPLPGPRPTAKILALWLEPSPSGRCGEWSAYPDVDPLGHVAGMMRGVSEVRAVVRWVQPQATDVVVSGISMGTPVAALVSHLERQIDAVALYTPILGLNAMIARHLGRWGRSRAGFREVLGSLEVSKLTLVIDRCAPTPRHHRAVGSSSGPGTTGWRCRRPRLPCTNVGAGSCTGTTAATSVTYSPGAFLG
jgi:hypothetical protein